MTQHEFEIEFKVKERNPNTMTATKYDYYCYAQDVWDYLDDKQKSYMTVEMMDDIISEYKYLRRHDWYWEDAVIEAICNQCYDPNEEYEEE